MLCFGQEARNSLLNVADMTAYKELQLKYTQSTVLHVRGTQHYQA